MTVSGSDGNDNKTRKIQEQVALDQLAIRRAALQRGQGVGKSTSDGVVPAAQGGSADSVRFSSLAVLFKEELNPERLAAERGAKIAALKARIETGSYTPPSEGVARALLGDIELASVLGDEL